MKHVIEGETWYPLTDIIKGRYNYWETRYNCKLTKELLEQAVEKGVVRTKEVQVENSPFTFTVYNEGDIIYAFAKSKFKVEVDTERWFK